MIRRVVAVVVAMVLAVVGTVLVLGYVNTADARAVAGKKAVTVLIAKERIPAGTTGATIRTEGLAEAVKMPAESIPAGVLGSIGQDLDKLVLTADLQSSQLLLRGMFGERVTSTGGLPIPEGKLAVSVALTAPQQVAGFVRPGATIAVFDTFNMLDDKKRIPNGEGLVKKPNQNQATRVLLPGVQVLAVGSYGAAGTETTNKTAETEEPDSSRNSRQTTVLVTVAVTQSEAERLVHAVQTGDLYLALVTESSDVTPGSGVDNRSLFK